MEKNVHRTVRSSEILCQNRPNPLFVRTVRQNWPEPTRRSITTWRQAQVSKRFDWHPGQFVHCMISCSDHWSQANLLNTKAKPDEMTQCIKHTGQGYYHNHHALFFLADSLLSHKPHFLGANVTRFYHIVYYRPKGRGRFRLSFLLTML